MIAVAWLQLFGCNIVNPVNQNGTNFLFWRASCFIFLFRETLNGFWSSKVRHKDFSLHDELFQKESTCWEAVGTIFLHATSAPTWNLAECSRPTGEATWHSSSRRWHWHKVSCACHILQRFLGNGIKNIYGNDSIAVVSIIYVYNFQPTAFSPCLPLIVEDKLKNNFLMRVCWWGNGATNLQFRSALWIINFPVHIVSIFLLPISLQWKMGPSMCVLTLYGQRLGCKSSGLRVGHTWQLLVAFLCSRCRRLWCPPPPFLFFFQVTAVVNSVPFPFVMTFAFLFPSCFFVKNYASIKSPLTIKIYIQRRKGRMFVSMSFDLWALWVDWFLFTLHCFGLQHSCIETSVQACMFQRICKSLEASQLSWVTS